MLGKCRPAADIAFAAFLAAQTPLDRADIARQVAPNRLIADRPCIELGAVAAASALHRHGVAVACVVADLVEPLTAHGLRLIAQTKLAAAVITAANASRIAELSTSMDHLRFVDGSICSHIVLCRKVRSENAATRLFLPIAAPKPIVVRKSKFTG